MALSMIPEHKMEIIELAVCDDCIALIANGELPVDSTEEIDYAIIEGTKDVFFGGDDLGFSHKPCDCCKRKLGGDRYLAYKPLEIVDLY